MKPIPQREKEEMGLEKRASRCYGEERASRCYEEERASLKSYCI